MKILRKIVEIDEERCNGCGQCLPNCAEGAITLVDGKARLKAEKLCDGLGACLGHCPMDAIRIVEREAENFDEQAMHAELSAAGEEPGKPLACGCPGTHAQTLETTGAKDAPCGCPGTAPATLPGAGALPVAGPAAGQVPGQARTFRGPALSCLGHWPVKLRLVPPEAPFLKGADILVLADCAAVALPDLHERIAGKVALTACPKFDDAGPHIENLVHILRTAAPVRVSVLRMEVPCCAGLSTLVHEAVRLAGTHTPVEEMIVARTGGVARAQNRPDQGLAARPLPSQTARVAP